MLHIETVEPRTFALLNELMAISEHQDFYLVGGTTFSLVYGHRASIDLDLFCPDKFENNEIIQVLENHFGNRLEIRSSIVFGIFCYIDNMKVDLVKHIHPLLNRPITKEGIRMFSLQDIVAMKVQAILGRAKKKTFWDIAEFLGHFGVEDFVELHKEKFKTQNLLITVPQAISYFSEAEEDDDPISLKGQTWDSVKKTIQKKVAEYLA